MKGSQYASETNYKNEPKIIKRVNQTPSNKLRDILGNITIRDTAVSHIFHLYKVTCYRPTGDFNLILLES